jgi:hypothetical protein
MRAIKDAPILLAKRFVGIEAQQAGMTAVDVQDSDLHLKTQTGMKGTRIKAFFIRRLESRAGTARLRAETQVRPEPYADSCPLLHSRGANKFTWRQPRLG